MLHKISPRMYIPYYILHNKIAKLNVDALKLLQKYECYFGSRDCTRSLWIRITKPDVKRFKVLLRNTDWKDHFYQVYDDTYSFEFAVLANDKELLDIITCNAGQANIYDRILSDSLRNTMLDFMHRNENQSYMHSVLQYLRNYPANVSDPRNFTVNNKGRMTYLPAGKHTELTDNDNWSTKNRHEIAYGRGLRKIFSFAETCIPDDYIERMSNYLRSQFEFTGIFKYIKGPDIKTWYHQDTYHPNAGTLNNSCMKKPACQRYLDVYVNNPETVRMLIAVDSDDKLIGRALLWTTVKGEKFMDRVYGNDQTIQAFLEHARDNGFYHKRYQNHSSADHVLNSAGNEADIQLMVYLDTSNCDYLPYMDTFKYTDDPDDGHFNNIEGEYVLENIDGAWPTQHNYVTTICGTRVHEEDARWSEYHHEWYLEDDVVWSNYHNSYIEYEQCIILNDEYYMSDAECIVHSEYEDEYIHVDDAIYSEPMEDYIYDHRAKEMIDGKYVDMEATETRLLMYSTIASQTNISGPELNEYILHTARTFNLTIRHQDNNNYIEYECYKEDYAQLDHIASFLIAHIKARISMLQSQTT